MVVSSRSARLAAWLALAAAVGAGVALIIFLIGDILDLVLVLIALGIAGAAGWIGLTRRGLLRVLGLLIAIVAIVAAVVLLVFHVPLWELAILVVAVALFGVLSQTAVRQAYVPQRPERQPVTEHSSRQRRRAVLLMNPKSGDGKPERFHLEDEARRRNIEPILLQPGQDWRAIAREAAGTADIIGMAGGDGSQAMVAQIAMEHDLPYVCIPAGTRNHLALDLGLDRDDVVGALDAFWEDREYLIDLAFVNDRIFVNNVSLGIYAEIVQSDEYRAAKLQTMGKKLPDLLGPRATPFDLCFIDEQGNEHRTAQLILVSNNPYRLDTLAGMGSRAHLDTGTLGIVAVDIANAEQASELVTLESLGQVSRFRGWTQWTAPEFEVSSSSEIATGIDGEGVKLPSPLRFRIVPHALHVQLPPSAGLSPAAAKPGLTASGISSLWRIAVGSD